MTDQPTPPPAYTTARLGAGSAVHLFRKDYPTAPLCNHSDNRGQTPPRRDTTDPATCKKCLHYVQRDEQRRALAERLRRLHNAIEEESPFYRP